MIGEMFVEHREIGCDDVARGKIVAEKLGEEGAGFFEGGFGEEIVEIIIGVEAFVGRGAVDATEFEPVIEKGFDEEAGFFIV